MNTDNLYKSRKTISTQLRKLFDDIYIQFVRPWKNINWTAKKSLSQSIQKFEKRIYQINVEDIEFFILEFENFMKIFQFDSDLNNHFDNIELINFINKLTGDDKDVYYVNRNIVISIMTSFISKIKNECNSNFKSEIKFVRGPSDFIELVVSLEKSGSIKRVDGKILTRDVLIKTLEIVFNMESRTDGYNNLLSKKTNSIYAAPFLTELTKIFKDYCSKKKELRNK